MKAASILLSALAAASAVRSLYLLGAGESLPAAVTLAMAIAFVAVAYAVAGRSGDTGPK